MNAPLRSVHTRDGRIYVSFPECEAVIKRTTGVLGAGRLKSNARVNTTGASTDVRGDEVVKENAHPLSRSRATTIERSRSCLRDISGTGSDGG